MKTVQTPDYEGPDRRNGQSLKLLWWILGTITSVVILGGSAWLTKVQADIGQLTQIAQVRGERLAALETLLPVLGQRLTRIEEKLDLMLEQRR